MKKVIGMTMVLTALAVLSGSAFAESLSEFQPRPTWTLEDHLNLDPVPFEGKLNDSLKEIIMKDSILPVFLEEHRFISDFDISLPPGILPLQPKMKPQLVSMASIPLIGNKALSTARAIPTTLPGILDIDLLELSPDMKVRLKVSDSSDIPIRIVRPDLTSTPGAFSMDAEENLQTKYGYKVGSEFQWLFSQNFGLFLEYRFLHSDIDIDPTTRTVTPNLDSDSSSHSVLGGIGFRF